MSRYRIVVCLFGAVVAVLAWLIPAASPQPRAVVVKKTFSPYRTQHRHFENVGPKSLGDTLFARRILLDAQNTKERKGSWVAELTFFRRARFSATGTFFLRNGEVTVEGVTTVRQNLSSSGGEFAITGGTGAYEGAFGTLTARDGVKVNGRRGNRFTLEITVP
jgi:hypothetical protein